MFNVNQITTTLRGMGDRALQQYAMMNKGDPYILSLAVSESNQRKQLRSAAQARNMAPQPKIADAAIAGMSEAPAVDAMGNVTGMASGGLPENQGIARIPAPNIQRMADGGIAGYGDDQEGMATGGMGGMFNYAQDSGPVLRMAGGGAVQKFAGKGEQLVRTTDGGKTWFLDVPAPSRGNPSPASALANMKFSSKQEAIEAFNALANTGTVEPQPVWGMGMPMNVGMPAGTDVSTLKQPAYVPPVAAPGAQPSGNKPPAPPVEKQGLATLAPSKAMTAEEAKTQAGDFVDFEESRTALRKAETDQESQGARLRTMLADNLPKTPAMEGLEKLLDKQDAATGGEKDKAAGLALLSAGLAIAGGSSRFALQNLKEAIPAVTQYGEALKDIKKMERENMKLRGDIEQARRAESRDDTKLKLQLEEKIGDRQDKINELGIGLTSKIAGTTADIASKLWSTSFDAQNRKEIALFEAQNRKDVAGISANAQANAELNKYTQLGLAAPESALRKGFSLYQQDRQQAGILANYEKMAGDQTMTAGGKYATKGEEFRAKYPTPEMYAAAIASLSGSGGQGQIYSDNNVNPNAVRSR